ncbi:hypothetical protein FGF1_03210 [Flavobacteriaceae bacterium GF1]
MELTEFTALSEYQKWDTFWEEAELLEERGETRLYRVFGFFVEVKSPELPDFSENVMNVFEVDPR